MAGTECILHRYRRYHQQWYHIEKAGTIILIASCVVWFLSGFGFSNGRFMMVEDMDHSILASLGSLINFVFKPLGFGTWQATVASLLGLIAKEEIVGVFGVLYNDLSEAFTPLSGYSFLVFNLLCVPCMAAVGAIKREMNSQKWTLFAVGYQCAFAYFVAFCIYQFGMMFATGVVNIATIIAFILLAVFLFFLLRKPKHHVSKSAVKTEVVK